MQQWRLVGDASGLVAEDGLAKLHHEGQYL